MFEIIVKKRFLASHGLRHYKGSQEPPHDHQWIVEARFHAEALDKAGCAIDFRDIDRALQEILSQFQGKTLNDLDPFRNTSPSAENVARYIFTKLSEATIKQESRLVSLTAWEDEEHGATYKE
jgi:6-pyruvoyltetrahydropterin/6-carboxytetrahydropterin synthase